MGNTLSLPALDVPRLLRKYGLHPDKRLGQVFLVDPVALQQVVDVANITSSDVVLEIGPGLGSLTRYLAARGGSIIAVELDENLIEPLKHVINSFNNVQVVRGDILELDLSQIILAQEYLIVANIPYYITSAVIRHLLSSHIRPKCIVLTVQQEVAIRICATPGNLSLLALSVQVFGRPQLIAHIPAGAFYPPPEVDSAVLRIELFPEPLIPSAQLDAFFRLAKAGFSQKRKTIRNSLAGGLALKPDEVEQLLLAANIEPRRRAESLSLEEWGKLTSIFVTRFV